MELEKELVEPELERICASSGFRNKPVMQKLLGYLVTEYLEGRAEQISGFSIGVDVFGRAQSADPTSTALVRNNALRLRRLLETYYLGEGKHDQVQIEIPKGQYAPAVSTFKKGADAAPARGEDSRPPGISVVPFRNLSGNRDIDFLATGFSQSLADALTKFDDLRVIGLGPRTGSQAPGAALTNTMREKGVEFLVDGEVQTTGSKVKISFHLIRLLDEAQLWSDSVKLDLEKDDLFDVEERITLRLASLFGGEFGHINQSRYQAILSSRPRTLTEQEVLLKHYHHTTVLTEESAIEFHEAVTRGLEADPDSALLHACAAGISNHIWASDYPGADEALEKLAYHAEKAYVLNPNHQWVLGNLATKCVAFDERDRFFMLFDRNKDVLANSPLRLGAWAMWICFWGEWGRGKKLLDRVLDDNLHVPLWLYGTTTLYHYRKHDFETALVEARKYRIPGLFWGPALRVAILGQLGRKAEAEREFADLLECRPDFQEKGRTLVGRVVKDSSVVDHVFEGFEKIGVTVASHP